MAVYRTKINIDKYYSIMELMANKILLHFKIKLYVLKTIS